MLVAFALAVLAPSLWAQQDKGAADSPQASLTQSIEQLVKNSGNRCSIQEPACNSRTEHENSDAN